MTGSFSIMLRIMRENHPVIKWSCPIHFSAASPLIERISIRADQRSAVRIAAGPAALQHPRTKED